MPATDESGVARLLAFAERAADRLRADERVRALWLTGSLAAGTGDAQSDVDLRAAVRAEDFATISQWWRALIGAVAPTVWARRWPSAPDEAVLSAITLVYERFDLVVQSAEDSRPRLLEATRLLFDKDGLSERLPLRDAPPPEPLASLPFVVEEFIRLVGMLPMVVERDDVPMGMEGQMGLHSLLISLLLMECGIDRATSGKRHVVAHLDDEQRAVLAQVPTLAPTMDSIIQGRLAYARLFLPRAQRLMQAHRLSYPAAFEAATRRYLLETLGVAL